MPEYEIRQATLDDARALDALSRECFGYPMSDGPPRDPNGRGRTTWVATFDGGVVASVADIAYESWWWGSRLPTSGIASVKVAVEHRGGGLVRRLFDVAHARARERGALVSTLFPTAPGIYHSLGYEVIGSYDEQVELPTVALGEGGRGTGRLVRGGEADLPTLRGLHAAWAEGHNGPLVREGAPFPTEGTFSGMEVTIVQNTAGAPRGYVIWNREGGYSTPEATVRVHDFVALDADAGRRMLAGLATNASVAPRTVWSMSGIDVPGRLLPQWPWHTVVHKPYMLAVLDVPGVLTARTYAPTLALETTFAVDDGIWKLQIADGRARLTPGTDEPLVRFTRRGFAMVWSGSASLHSARLATLATGDDPSWTLLAGGRDVHVRDYF